MSTRRKVEKSYFDREFLESSDARSIRILSEYFHPQQIFRKKQVHDTIVFFGSARAKSPRELRQLKLEPDHDETVMHKLSKYYVDACRLSYKLTKWSKELPHGSRQFLVCTGGGHGIMEAANRGAFLARGRSIGLNIALPMEQTPNKYISHSLNFDFNYFFMRKYWFTYLAKALIVFPGGFGTIDELFELLTLKQTHKLEKPMPIVIFGSEYWKKLINFDTFVEWETISKSDMDYVHFSDTVEDAFDYLTTHLTKLYMADE